MMERFTGSSDITEVISVKISSDKTVMFSRLPLLSQVAKLMTLNFLNFHCYIRALQLDRFALSQ